MRKLKKQAESVSPKPIESSEVIEATNPSSDQEGIKASNQTIVNSEVVETVEETVEETVKEPVNEPVKETVKEPMKETVKEPMKEPMKETVKEPMKEPMKEPVKEPVKEPIPSSIPTPPYQHAGTIPPPRDVLSSPPFLSDPMNQQLVNLLLFSHLLAFLINVVLY